MSNVTAVQPKGEKNALLILDDGTQVWTPDIDKAKELKLGEPIPPTWTMKDGQYGPQAFPPREGKGFGGGATAFRNSKEGQFYEQERMDRRTALMQMVAAAGLLGKVSEDDLKMAEWFYAWLRKSAGSAPSSAPPNTGSDRSPFRPEPGPSAVEPGKAAADTSGAAGKGTGEGPEPAASHVNHKPGCTEPGFTPLKVNGEPMPAGKVRCIECSVWDKEA